MENQNSKIKTRQEIKKIVEELKSQGKKIVTINGSFDILHIGHIKMLEEAKKQGDVLILGLNTDKSVQEWKKHQGTKDWEKRPINNQWARSEFLSAIKHVDYIELFPETDCIPFLENIKPDIHVNGSDYGEDCIEAPTVKKYGGKIYIAKFIEGYSSTKLINKILEIYGKKA